MKNKLFHYAHIFITFILVVLVGGATMQPESLIKVLEKLANSEQVDPSEIEKVRQGVLLDEANLRQLRASNQSGSLVPNFDEFTSGYGAFDVVPSDALWVRQLTNFSVANDTAVDVEFASEPTKQGSRYFKWDASQPEKIFISVNAAGRLFMACGTVAFDPSGTGYRRVTMNYYSNEDVLVAQSTMAQVTPMASDSVHVSYCVLQPVTDALVNGGYITIKVRQTSGGNLDVQNVKLGLVMVR